jgi:Flp pilus assembly protein CpaB
MLAVVAVAAAVVLVVSTRPSASTVAPVPTTQVVVTTQAVQAGQAITSADLTLVQRPISQVPTGTYNAVQTALGRDAAIDLPADVTLTQAMTVPASSGASTTTTTVTGAPFTNIPAGDVAMAIPDSALTGVAGYIEIGDHIDILAQVDGTSHYVAQDVPVLALSGSSTPSTSATTSGATSSATQPAAAPESANLLVVELSRYEAEQVSLIVNPPSGFDAGILEYVIRPTSVSYKNTNPTATPELLPSTPGASTQTLDPGVTPQQLSSAFGT